MYLFSGLFTLTGLCIYIKYSNQAMENFKQVAPQESLVDVDMSYGWSMAAAWVSYSLEVTTGLLLMLAARITQMKGHYESGVAIAMLGSCFYLFIYLFIYLFKSKRQLWRCQTCQGPRQQNVGVSSCFITAAIDAEMLNKWRCMHTCVFVLPGLLWALLSFVHCPSPHDGGNASAQKEKDVLSI